MALTADDVMGMVESGMLGEDDRVELLGGELVEMSPKSPQHGEVLTRLLHWLIQAAPAGGYKVRPEHPLRVPDPGSLPEPDLAVIAADTPGTEHPTTALLVIEIAVSSTRIDTEVKAPLYASAGVPECWVVDVPRRRLHVFVEAAGDRFRQQEIVDGGTVAPRAIDAPPLELAQLFAGL